MLAQWINSIRDGLSSITHVTPLPSTKEMYGMLAQWISSIRDGFSSITSNSPYILWGSLTLMAAMISRSQNRTDKADMDKTDMETMKQAHDYEAEDTGDQTTVNTNEKEVKDLALEPDVADKRKLDYKCPMTYCGEQFNQKTDLEKHMS